MVALITTEANLLNPPPFRLSLQPFVKLCLLFSNLAIAHANPDCNHHVHHKQEDDDPDADLREKRHKNRYCYGQYQ